LVKTTIEIDDDLWRIVKIRADKEDVSYSEALMLILKDFIKNHGMEYGYPLEEIQRR